MMVNIASKKCGIVFKAYHFTSFISMKNISKQKNEGPGISSAKLDIDIVCNSLSECGFYCLSVAHEKSRTLKYTIKTCGGTGKQRNFHKIHEIWSPIFYATMRDSLNKSQVSVSLCITHKQWACMKQTIRGYILKIFHFKRLLTFRLARNVYIQPFLSGGKIHDSWSWIHHSKGWYHWFISKPIILSMPQLKKNISIILTSHIFFLCY